MTLSEILEVLGALLLTLAFAIGFAAALGAGAGLVAGLFVAGAALVYFAHVYDETPDVPQRPQQ